MKAEKLWFALAFLAVVFSSAAQQVDTNALAADRNRLVLQIAQYGYTFLKPEFRPSVPDVADALSTRQKVSAALGREQTALKEAQNLLKTTKTVDGQIRFLGKVLDSMMGALLGAGTQHGDKVKAAENLLNMQAFVDAANEMIRCSMLRQDALTKIMQIDHVIAQASRPAKLPGKQTPSRHASPYAF